MNKSTSTRELERMMDLVKYVIFPDYSDVPKWTDGPAAIREILLDQLPTVMAETAAPAVAQSFVNALPEIGRLLNTDVQAVAHNDPAVRDLGEVVLCYPLVKVMLNYRSAHCLHELGVPRIPRILTEMAHSATGIDIHPAATIGEYFAIDHGTGVVVGATSIIGNHVMLYQGVTLGAKSFSYDEQGHPIDKPRHPILEDNVTVYSNTSILGRVTIGHDTIVGGNIWLTHDVPPCSIIRQGRAVEIRDAQDSAEI
ncbi:MAG: serine acetyltransferase [Bacteroidaceae bacterium]|nr:serine acetyltransferase [Bacteroidaceae bacterium]